MPSEERIKRGKYTFKVFQLQHGGKWYAGGEGSSGATREAAIQAHLKVARAGDRASTKASKVSAKAADVRRAKRAGKECMLTYCSGAIDTPAHRRSAKHRNAVAVENARRTGSYRV